MVPNRGFRRSRAGGFTVLELMIVVSILGVLVAIAIPNFDELIKNNRRTVIVNELVSTFMLARAEAAKRGIPVSVCPANEAFTACANAADWSARWLAWVDADQDGAVDGTEIDEPGEVIKKFASDYADAIKITSAAPSSTLPDGVAMLRPFNQGSATGRMELTVCDSRGARKARAVIVEQTGRPRSSETRASGEALSCG